MMHQRLTNGHTNIQRVISALNYKDVYRKQRSLSKPDQQVGEIASVTLTLLTYRVMSFLMLLKSMLLQVCAVSAFSSNREEWTHKTLADQSNKSLVHDCLLSFFLKARQLTVLRDYCDYDIYRAAPNVTEMMKKTACVLSPVVVIVTCSGVTYKHTDRRKTTRSRLPGFCRGVLRDWPLLPCQASLRCTGALSV